MCKCDILVLLTQCINPNLKVQINMTYIKLQVSLLLNVSSLNYMEMLQRTSVTRKFKNIQIQIPTYSS